MSDWIKVPFNLDEVVKANLCNGEKGVFHYVVSLLGDFSLLEKDRMHVVGDLCRVLACIQESNATGCGFFVLPRRFTVDPNRGQLFKVFVHGRKLEDFDTLRCSIEGVVYA